MAPHNRPSLSKFTSALLLATAGVALAGCHPSNLECADPPTCSGWVGALAPKDAAAPIGPPTSPPTNVPIPSVDAAPAVNPPASPDGGPGDVTPPKQDSGAAVQPPPPPLSPSGSTPLVGCAKAKTVAEFEKEVLAKSPSICTTCHTAGNMGLYGIDLASADTFKRLIDKAPLKTCTSGKLIDTAAPEKSIFLLKMFANPKCPDGSAGGGQMPFSNANLGDDLNCYKAYVSALTGKSVN